MIEVEREQPRTGDGEPADDFIDCAPELASAGRHGPVGFAHVALAFLFGRDGADEVSEHDRQACRRLFPRLLERYEVDHGEISRSYFGRHVFAAAALTSGDEIGVIWGPHASGASRKTAELIFRAEAMGYAAWHRLAPFDRRLCQNMIFDVILEALRRIDRRAADPAANAMAGNGNGRHDDIDDADLAFLHHELDEAEEFMLRSATRRAQIRYLQGMLLGTIATGLLVVLAANVLELFAVSPAVVGHVVLVLAAGSLAAVVSVLSRMTFGNFRMNLPTLSHETGRRDLWLMGALRPALGGVFGVAVYVFAASTLLPLPATTAGQRPFMYAAVAFIAGFSERFAQDMFVRSGHGLSGQLGQAPSSGPSAGLSPIPGRGEGPKAEAADEAAAAAART